MNMIQCGKCKAWTPGGARYCGTCGYPVDNELPVRTAISKASGDIAGINNVTAISTHKPVDPKTLIPPVQKPKDTDETLISGYKQPIEKAQAAKNDDFSAHDLKTIDEQLAHRALNRAEMRSRENIMRQSTAPLDTEQEKERREKYLLPLLGAGAAMGPQPTQTPMASGTPQFNNAPSVAGNPQPPLLQAPMLDKPPMLDHGTGARTLTRAAHKPVATVAKTTIPKSAMYIGTCVVVVTAVVATTVILSQPPRSGSTAGKAAIKVSAGTITPGGSISVHGEHFVPNGTVNFSIDKTPISSFSVYQAGLALALRNMNAILQTRQAEENKKPVVVRKDGTFDATLLIPKTLPLAKTYILLAEEQGISEPVTVKITIDAPQITRPCINAPPGPLTFTMEEGKTQPGPKTLTISNCGRAGKITISVKTSDGANWLKVKPTNVDLEIEGQKEIQVEIDSKGLKAGNYTGEITFAIGEDTSKTSVAFNIAKPDAKWCLNVSPSSLTYTAQEGAASTDPQDVTVSNCGDPGTVLASPVDSNDSSWINGSSTSIELKANETKTIPWTISNVGTAGTYNSRLAFTLGTVTRYVDVILHVTPRAPEGTCSMAVSPNTLAFEMIEGGANPTEKLATVSASNCGATSATLTSSAAWLKTSVASVPLNAGNQNVGISINGQGLQASTQPYTGAVTFKVGTLVRTVSVSLTVKAPLPTCSFTVSPTSLAYEMQEGSADPKAKPFTVTGSNCGTTDSAAVTSSADWLYTDVSSVALSGNSKNVSVGVSGKGLKASDTPYTGTITVKAGTLVKQVAVSLTVTAPCTIAVSPVELTYTMQRGGANPQTQAVTVSGKNCGTSSVTVTPSQSWITTRGDSVAVGSSISIGINGANLEVGTYTGSVTFTIGSQTKTVSVTLTVTEPPAPKWCDGNDVVDFGNVEIYNTYTRTITLGNCGNAAGTANQTNITDYNFQWLQSATPTSATIYPDGVMEVTITVKPGELEYDQIYKGQVTYTMNGVDKIINVSIKPIRPVIK
jgi:hypothetical protein